ncbi:hypothetical protein HNP46_004213 [Pseudomonas nitritireducens]|uniref:Uncharacterized protein n=1 Tax=Pseudomonas nitroreducens TaxID=46680 RepID=A0A7W7KM46_PSENT|nr:hypothetical protein [Pseudomonas nitritireducens]MBB4865332.1 hypothetical protein [Pseudomonas nitritireducens]
MYFLTLPFNFSASNLKASDFMVGMPAMTAAAGMAHKAQCIMKEELGLKTFEFKAFSLIYFSLDRDSSAPRRPPQEARHAGAEMVLPSGVDIRRGAGEAALTLYFTLKDDADFEPFEHLLSQESNRLARALTAGLRFAGGSVVLGLPGEGGSTAIQVFMSQTWEAALRRLVRAYPTKGLVIQCESELFSQRAKELDDSPVEAMCDLLYRSRLQRYEEIGTVAAVDEMTSAAELLVSDDLFDLDAFSLDLDMAHLDSPEFQVGLADEPYLGILLPNQVGYHQILVGQDEERVVEPVGSIVRAKILPSALTDLTLAREHWSRHFWEWHPQYTDNLYITLGYSPAKEA